MNSTDRIVRPNDVFMTRAQIAALIDAYNDMGPEVYERYMQLRYDAGNHRHMLDHDEAMAVLIEDISVTDCFRLKAAGGNMQEIADLSMMIFEVLNQDAEDAIENYIALRCRFSTPADKAFSAICKEYGIDEENYSVSNDEVSFSNL